MISEKSRREAAEGSIRLMDGEVFNLEPKSGLLQFFTALDPDSAFKRFNRHFAEGEPQTEILAS